MGQGGTALYYCFVRLFYSNSAFTQMEITKNRLLIETLTGNETDI